MDFREMLDFHIENGGDLTIATIPVNAKDATGFGILKSDDEGNITSFYEKPDYDMLDGLQSEVSDENKRKGKEYLASMGIYIFTKTILKRCLMREPETILEKISFRVQSENTTY